MPTEQTAVFVLNDDRDDGTIVTGFADEEAALDWIERLHQRFYFEKDRFAIGALPLVNAVPPC